MTAWREDSLERKKRGVRRREQVDWKRTVERGIWGKTVKKGCRCCEWWDRSCRLGWVHTHSVNKLQSEVMRSGGTLFDMSMRLTWVSTV